MKHRKIEFSTKVALILSVTIFLAMTSFSYFIIEKNNQILENQLKEKISNLRTFAKLSIVQPLWNFDMESIKKATNAIVQAREVKALELYTSSDKGKLKLLYALKKTDNNNIVEVDKNIHWKLD